MPEGWFARTGRKAFDAGPPAAAISWYADPSRAGGWQCNRAWAIVHDLGQQDFLDEWWGLMRTLLIVGVSGGSGAGKHLVIHDYLVPALGHSARVIEHDWYYREFEDLYRMQGVSSRADINYDRPDAYENELLVHHLKRLVAGETVEIHRYRKGVGLREIEPVRIEPQEVIILDGMMLFAVPELVRQVHLRAYVHASDQVRLQRRVRRDIAFSTVDESVIRFQRDVLPAHRRYVEPSAVHAGYILVNSRDGCAPEGIQELVSGIDAALRRRRGS